MNFREPSTVWAMHQKSGVLIPYSSFLRPVVLLFMLTPSSQFPTGKFFILVSIWSLVTSITVTSLKLDGAVGVALV